MGTIKNFRKMLLHYLGIKKIYLLILILILVEACSTNSNSTNFKKESVKEFYDRLRQHESDLSIFHNVTFTAIGVKDGRPFIPFILITLNEDEEIILPGIYEEMSDKEIMHHPFFDNIEAYSNKVGLTDSVLAYKEVKDYCVSILELADKLDIYSVYSTSQLGACIVFELSPNDDLIYVLDSSKVNREYWKFHIKTGEKLDENWYYISPQSQTIDSIASFPGGKEQLDMYLKKNTQRQQSQFALEDMVCVSFLVTENGNIVDVEVIKSLSESCDKEAIRLVKNMPKWIPAKKGGKSIESRVFLPIYFKLCQKRPA